MEQKLPASSDPSCTPRRRTWLLPWLIVGLLFVGWGANRQPADATAPIVWQVPPAPTEADSQDFRIASFNIHGGKGRDGKRDLVRIANELAEIDFAGLYEVHSSPWSQPRAQSAQIGDRLGLQSAFLPTERRWWHDHFGNAVLARRNVAHIHRIPLAGTRGKAFRQAVLVHYPHGEATIAILLAHVDSQQDREQQLADVIRLFASLSSPAILMGDLNTRASDPQLQGLLSQPGVERALPQDADDALKSSLIDWIIVRGLEIVTAEIRDTGASDHPILRATLRVSKE